MLCKDLDGFYAYLISRECSINTVKSYVHTVSDYFDNYDELSSANLIAYKNKLVKCCQLSSVNQKICALNTYCRYIGADIPKLKQFRKHPKNFKEDVISEEDYELLKEGFLREKPMMYYLIQFMACTGMRVSEVLTLRVEDLSKNYKEITGKGGKSRNVYIPSRLATEAMNWCKSEGRTRGPLFLNLSGDPVTVSGVQKLLKHHGVKYGVAENRLHPHAFRHFFAIKFLEARPDVTMLSDILGHENVETTRIYLRRSALEQGRIINNVVNW